MARQAAPLPLKRTYKSIWLVGGGLLTRKFLRAHLVDDVRITIALILLGNRCA